MGGEEKQEGVEQTASYAGLENALSLERFGRYLGWAENDRERAFELYALNTSLSEALYTPLQILEVALRNRIHGVMTAAYSERWFHDTTILVGIFQPDQVAKAISDIEDEKKEATPGRIVAALTLSFWTAMLGKQYENLWQTTLKEIGRKASGQRLRRKDFSGRLSDIRKLRNRIAHHEPILKLNLIKLNDDMLELTGWLSPVAAEWCKAHSRVSAVLPTETIDLYEKPKTTLTEKELAARAAAFAASKNAN